MQKISTHLWYDKEALESAELYSSIFADSGVTGVTTIHDTPSGDADIVSMRILGQDFMLINAGPYFKFTPAISMFVACSSVEEAEKIWKEISNGGDVLMELGAYPFSKKYGWTTDKYGLSWQVMFMEDMPITQKIIPTLMFTGGNAGKAEEAMNYYTSVFNNSRITEIARYEEGESEFDKVGTVKHAGFVLEGVGFAAMDSAYNHGFTFNEAISFIINCTDQEEIDYYWEKLSAVPEAEQCGWLKDKYGVSWQIVPEVMNIMLGSGNKDKIAKVTEAFLKMKKFDIAKLEEAYNN
ncbi:VOC family protein [candidate division WWE3 bacterium]|jgi:predicted 3-demethylubiquinone-9 3-methyltransferase (glyoxalase superfamily)|uniref:VOC family protein n=1 Tax=candidate division WWE3 bacterium TaxID=2053526 RepID=A0A3A4ZME8_UNCKA|nr:MAG: VOC family protein [candidate division WWE3 bacterium]